MRSSANSRRSVATSVSALRRQQTSLINIPAFSGARWNRSSGAVGYLQLTVEGRQWIANLYCNVFEIEHTRRSMGPESGTPSSRGASGLAELVSRSPDKRY